MFFSVTVDTEADNQWAQSGSLSLRNLEGLTRFHACMKERGIPPTYFATYETLSHPTLSFLAQEHKNGNAEIGAHLHPWTTPPLTQVDARIQRFPSELTRNELREKMHTLTAALHALIGEVPTSFRAGRWGFSMEVAYILEELGYTVDSSITPFTNWGRIVRDRDVHSQIPNFSSQDAHPYRLPGTGVLEVPMSIVPSGIARGRIAQMLSLIPFGEPIVRKLIRPRWCRIFPETNSADLRQVYNLAREEGLPVLVFMTHSSELSVGTSPYVKDDAALEHVYAVLNDFLGYLASEGVKPVRLRDVETLLSV